MSEHPGQNSSKAQTRSCGGCNVCCTVMTVTPLNKPGGAVCPHQTEAGCGIYEDRPGVCRAWHCMWVRDNGRVFREEERPDKSGVFFTASKPDPKTGNQMIYVHQVREGTAEAAPGRAIIERLGALLPIKVLPAPKPQPAVTLLTYNGKVIDRAA